MSRGRSPFSCNLALGAKRHAEDMFSRREITSPYCCPPVDDTLHPSSYIRQKVPRFDGRLRMSISRCSAANSSHKAPEDLVARGDRVLVLEQILGFRCYL